MSTGSWDDLATVALLGTARRRLDDVSLPPPLAEAAGPVTGDAEASDPAARLLDLAALGTVYLRAGLRTGPPRTPPPPAPPDSRRPVGAAARARLAGLLASNDRELLALWLATAAERQLRPPGQALPALLDHAVRHPRLVPAVMAAAGPRGRWLAAFRPHWATLLASADPAESAGGAGRGDGPGDPRLWETGAPAERLAWLGASRARDPATARELLASGWTREAPDGRAALLAVLADGLAPDDEPLLENCLDDRRADVRAVAARLLTALPGSGLSRRATERALAAVRVERQGHRRRILVSPPGGHDAVMARDQIPAPPGQPAGGRGGGPGAWLLLHVVAAAPLAAWIPSLGGTPSEVTALDIADGWPAVLWLGWARAAARERDAEWAAALLTHPPPGRADVSGAVAALLALLPAAVAARYLADVLDTRDAARLPVSVAALLQPAPPPWGPPLSRAVLGWLHRRTRLDDPDGRAVLDLAARRMPVELAGALQAVADRWPELSPSHRFAGAAARLLTVRREMLEELQ